MSVAPDTKSDVAKSQSDVVTLRTLFTQLARSHIAISHDTGHLGSQTARKHGWTPYNRNLIDMAEQKAYQNNTIWSVRDDGTIVCSIHKGLVEHSDKETMTNLLSEVAYDLFISNVMQITKDNRQSESLRDLNRTLGLELSKERTIACGGHPSGARERTKQPSYEAENWSKVLDALPNHEPTAEEFSAMMKAPEDEPDPISFAISGAELSPRMTLPAYTADFLIAMAKRRAEDADLIESVLESKAKAAKAGDTETNATWVSKAVERLDKLLEERKDRVSVLPGGGIDVSQSYEVTETSTLKPGKTYTGKDLMQSAIGNMEINPLEVKFQFVNSNYDHEQAILHQAKPIVEKMGLSIDWP